MTMTKTLYAKLALVLLGLFSFIAVLYLILTYYSTSMYLKEVNQRLHKDLAKNLVAENILMINGEINAQNASLSARSIALMFPC